MTVRLKQKAPYLNFFCIVTLLLIGRITKIEAIRCDLKVNYLCWNEQKCIPKLYLCNGVVDCPDKDDELNCDISKCDNKEKFFKCRDGNGCVGIEVICDDEADCHDASDESDEMCDARNKVALADNTKPAVVRSAPVKCNSENEFQCDNHSCIPIEEICNGVHNCMNGKDEDKQMCEAKKIKCPGFKCANGKCLERHDFECDGTDDCGDGSDEMHCALDCKLSDDKFLCSSGDECIDFNKVCNGKPDCVDKSDENGQCSQKDQNPCKNLNCPTTCKFLPTGPTCVCEKGFSFNNKSAKCEDINECEIFGTCSQGCVNTNGSYYCTCAKHFNLNENDKKSCDTTSSDVSLFYTTRKGIKKISLGQKDGQFHDLISNAKQSVGIAFDGEYYYWTEIDVGKEVIVKLGTTKGAKKEILLTNGLELPEYIAVDWLTKNIYFTDSYRKHIAVCTNDGYHCTELVKSEIMDFPRGIAIHPLESLLFWTDWGNHSHIGVSFMDGSKAKILVDDVVWPNGLTLDWPNSRIYWVDASRSKIESTTIEGKDRRVILEDMFSHPFALAIYGNNLYWCDRGSKSIEYCDKFTGKNHDVLTQGDDIFDVHIYDAAAMPQIKHACIDNDCSHICLLSSNNSHTCACPVHMELMIDGRSCQFSSSAYTIITGIGPYVMSKPYMAFGRSVENPPIRMDYWLDRMEYNSLNGDIFYADNHKNVISVITPQGKSYILVKDQFLTVSSMSFDYLANNLYWSDENKGTIEVFSLTKKIRAIIHHYTGSYKPNAIVLVPSIGEMFVALKSREHAHIDRHSIKGEMFDDNHHHVIESGLSKTGPFHMVVDEVNKMLYWSDTGNRRIECSNFDGSNRKLFIIPERAPGPLAIIGDELHWTSRRSETLRWKKINTKGQLKSEKINVPKGLNEADIPEIISLLAGIPLKMSNHPCINDNGGCSDICISDGPNSRVCQCAPGSIFKDYLNTTCVKRSICDFRCKSGECIEASKKCNHVVDCIDSSDEDKEMCKKHECLLDQFKCNNNECISINLRCDHHFDCKDNSDEMNCPTDKDAMKQCNNDQIQCSSDKNMCIYRTQICDGTKDCADGYDETEEMCSRKCPNDFKCKSGQCIPKEFECNHVIDCVDGSDEHDKCQTKMCEAPKRACRNGFCINSKLFCDGHDDCPDGFDELNCNATEIENTCQIGQFQCRSKPELCLPKASVCDKFKDCPLGEDEKGCNCPTHMFECDNGECIYSHLICDGKNDCKDHSDESACKDPKEERKITSVTCTQNTFKCSDGTCLDYSRVCDGNKDCDDDEGGSCDKSCKFENPCGSICRPTPKGSKCDCEEGYELKTKGDVNCTDIDECKTNPCSQICINTKGSFMCTCFYGYTLLRKTECMATGSSQKLFYILNDHVRMISQMPAMTMDIVYDTPIPLSDIAVDVAKQKLLVLSTDVNGLVAVNYTTKEIIETYRDFPAGFSLSYDYVTENAYISHRKEGGFAQIDVCNLKSKKCVMIKKFLLYNDNIASMDIDPINNYIFYAKVTFSVYSKFYTEIVRMRLDGSGLKVIFSESSKATVRALALDTDKKIIYFTEVSTQSLQAINYEGEKIQTFAYQSRMLRRPMAISIFENHAYVLDELNSKITRCKLYGDNSCNTLDINTASSHQFIISHEVKQKYRKNFCENHSCAEICVNADTGLKCLCSNGNLTAIGCKEVVKRDEIIDDDKESSSAGTVLLWMFIIIVILIAAAVGYHQYYQRGFHHNWRINYHFDRSNRSSVTEFEPKLSDLQAQKPRSPTPAVPFSTIEKSNYTECVNNNVVPEAFSNITTLQNIVDDDNNKNGLVYEEYEEWQHGNDSDLEKLLSK